MKKRNKLIIHQEKYLIAFGKETSIKFEERKKKEKTDHEIGQLFFLNKFFKFNALINDGSWPKYVMTNSM